MERIPTAAPVAAIVLAAGLGTRMKSALPKALHAVGGRPVIGHIAHELGRLGVAKAVLVVGPGMEGVLAAARAAAPDVAFEAAIQTDRIAARAGVQIGPQGGIHGRRVKRHGGTRPDAPPACATAAMPSRTPG